MISNIHVVIGWWVVRVGVRGQLRFSSPCSPHTGLTGLLIPIHTENTGTAWYVFRWVWSDTKWRSRRNCKANKSWFTKWWTIVGIHAYQRTIYITFKPGYIAARTTPGAVPALSKNPKRRRAGVWSGINSPKTTKISIFSWIWITATPHTGLTGVLFAHCYRLEAVIIAIWISHPLGCISWVRAIRRVVTAAIPS